MNLKPPYDIILIITYKLTRFSNLVEEMRIMKISTKGRYAVRMLLDLAQHNTDDFVALKDIAERQKISKKYLEQIVAILNRSDILTTNRGYKGGYKLAKPANQYKIGDILRLTEGSLAPVACLDLNPIGCEHSNLCPTLPIWKGLYKAITDYLDSITLQDIIDMQQNANDYVI